MKTNKSHNKESFDTSVYSNLKPPYSRTKEDVWFYMEQQLNREKTEKVVSSVGIRQLVLRYAIAAFLTLLVGIPAFMRFYTTSVTTSYGERAQITLPDGSMVQMNAVTEVSFYPYWWQYKREVKLNGEAYFDVEKGNKFTVKSDLGSTTVLGTTFNIFARDKAYEVACFSGLVRVENSNDAVHITPGAKASLIANNGWDIDNISDAKSILAWRNNEFYYTNTPLQRVLSDLELQYNIIIKTDLIPQMDTFIYSGNFTRDISVENVLNLVSKPYGFKMEKSGDNEYRLIDVTQ